MFTKSQTFFSVIRFVSRAGPIFRSSIRHNALASKHAVDQMEFIKTQTDNKIQDWATFKETLLNINGTMNSKNFEAILLKVLISEKKFDSALSFADYLKSLDILSLGATNGLLQLYYELGQQNKLNEEGKTFIQESYKNLYEKYKVLDATTCEKLLHALCVIDEWKKALKVLDNIHLSSKPTHSAYSTLIATFFKLNKKTEALNMVTKSVEADRPLLPMAYKHWIDYILRKYKDKKTKLKYLDDISVHISTSVTIINEETADMLSKAYLSLGWYATSTKIRKSNGQCMSCKKSLECLKLSDTEFELLQKDIKEKLIVGSDLFLKTSPEELKKFLDFVQDTAPYDVVLDALNIAFTGGKSYASDKVKTLLAVVEHFREQNKRILLLGRRHMLGWPRIKNVLSKTCFFLTENLSQDDPYFITAAILSGPSTDIVSKDLLRGHRFNLHDQQLQFLFQRWQWQHQWTVYNKNNGQTVIQSPLSVTPCAQKTGASWHLPYEGREPRAAGLRKDGVPDWHKWLCITPNQPT